MTEEQLRAFSGGGGGGAAPAAPQAPSSTPPAAPAPPSMGPAPKTPGLSSSWLKKWGSEKKPPNALQLAGDYLDVPFYALGAARRGGGDEYGKVFGSLAPNQIQDIADRYNLFSPEQLQVESQKGDPFAGWFLKHPKAAGAAQFGAEFLNPSNLVTGPLLGAAGKALGAGAKAVNAIPAVARATQPVAEHLTQLGRAFRPYAGLNRERGPESVRQGRSVDQAKATADEATDKLLRPVFGDLTPDQAAEVERRSENFGPEGVKNPPKQMANGKISDAELTARARAYRARLMQLDRRQLAAGVIRPDQMRQTRTYTPRWAKGAYKTAGGADIPEELSSYLEDDRPMGGESRAFKSGSMNKEKRFLSYDEAKNSGLMSDEYHSADNAAAHFRQRLLNIELQKQLKGFQPLDQLRPLEYGSFGEGQEGFEKMSKWADRTGKAQVSQELRSQLGLPGRFISASLPGKLEARLSEARKAQQQAGVMAGAAERGAQTVQRRAAAGFVDQAGRHQQVADLVAKQTARVAELGNALQRHQLVRELSASASPELRAQAASLQQAYLAAKKLARRAYRSGMGGNVDALLQRIASERMDRPAGSNLTVIGEGENTRTLGGQSAGYGPYGKGDVDAVAAALRKAGQKDADANAAMQHLDEAFNAIGEARSIVDDAAQRFNIQRAGMSPAGVAASVKDMQTALRDAAARARATSAGARVPQGIAQGIGDVERGQNAFVGRLNSLQRRAIDAGAKQADSVTQAAQTVAKRAFAGDARAAERVNSIADRLAQANISAAERDEFWKAFGPRARERTERLKAGMVNKAERAAIEQGFVPLDKYVQTTLRTVPILKHSAASRELANFLTAYGAPRGEADPLSQVIESMNKLTRIGIISNPLVHVLWNLNNQFLGAGGNPADLLKIYNPRWHPPEALVEAAKRNGAIVSSPPQLSGLGGLRYGKLIGSPEALSPRERIDQTATRIWDLNNAFTFNAMEERFATLLYAKFLDRGMSEAQAGIQVRKALGDYANVSRTGIEHTLNKAMFFYPWLKTIIPFWAHTLAVRPQWVNAPMQGIRANNLVGGDPNVDKERAWTVHLGNDVHGNPRYFSYPGPQKILSDMAEMVAPQGDIGAGPAPRFQAAEKVVQSHFNPTLSLAYDAANTIAKEPSDVGAPNFDILFDKDAPAGKQWQQLLTNAAERVIPAPMQLKQIVDFIRQLPQKGDVGGDILAGTATGIVGGTNYDRANPSAEKVVGVLRRRLTMMVGQLRKAGRADLADMLWNQYEQQRDALLSGR